MSEKKRPLATIERVVARLLGSVLWAYVLCALFFPAAEDLILVRYPDFRWVATYRALLILGLFSALWTALGTKAFARVFAYACSFPIICLIKLIRLNWQFFLSSAPLIYGFFQSIKFVIIGFTSFAIGVALVCAGGSFWSITTGVFLVGLFQLVFLQKQFSAAMESKTFFGKAAEAIEKFWGKFHETATFRLPEDYDLSTSEGITKATTPLMCSYVVFSAFNRFAKSAKNLADGKKLEVFCLASWIFTFLITVASFSFIFYGLKRNQPSSFSGGDSWPEMLGYSLSMATPATISEVKSISSLAKIASYTESLIILAIFVILILLAWENRRAGYRRDLARTVAHLDAASQQFETFFSQNFQLSIRSAERWLMEHQKWIFGWMLRMNYGPGAYESIQTELKNEPLINLPSPATKRKGQRARKNPDKNQ